MISLDEKIDRKAYQLAKAYLPSLNIPGVTEELVNKYLDPLIHRPKPTTKNELYERLLESAQNANMKAGVIGNSIGGFNNLSLVLHNFDAAKVLSTYHSWEDILKSIRDKLKPRGKIRTSPSSIWPRYCQTVLSAAKYIEQYASPEDFFNWVDYFDKDDRSRAGLPMILSHEIVGFGFALSSDFLKEIGYVNFPKPDIHLHDLFDNLKLYDSKKDKNRDYRLFKAIVRLSHNADVTAYNADKVFWLIGSGYFYNDPQIGKKGRIGSQKQDFVKYALPILSKLK